jgi:hypothetical protein
MCHKRCDGNDKRLINGPKNLWKKLIALMHKINKMNFFSLIQLTQCFITSKMKLLCTFNAKLMKF